MDSKTFVQNIKKYSDKKGIKPTVACKESGVGSSFINDVERGRRPLVTNVQLLAEYFGITTSELLGEKMPAGGEADGLTEEGIELINYYKSFSLEDRAALLSHAQLLAMARKSQDTRKGG